MNISEIFVTQRSLNRKDLIPSLLQSIKEDKLIDPIELIEQVDGKIRIDNGHHRLVAYYLSGRRNLRNYEYDLILSNDYRHIFGKVGDLIKRNNLCYIE
jgi:hypothetical protein